MGLTTVRGVELPEDREDIAIDLVNFETVYANEPAAMDALDLFIGQSILAGKMLSSEQRYLFGRPYDTSRGVEAVWVSDRSPATDEKQIFEKVPLLTWLEQLAAYSEQEIDEQRQQQTADYLVYLMDLHLFGLFASRRRYFDARHRFIVDKDSLQPV